MRFTRYRAPHSVFLAWVVLSLGAATGCGDGLPARVKISGTVMIDGKPLERGFIQVIPEKDRAASAEIGADGKFTLTTFDDNDGCVLGTHKVVVVSNESQGPYAMKWYAPKQYSDMASTPLTLEVKEPKEDVVIELSWDGGAPFVEQFEKEGDMPAPEAAPAQP